MRMNFTQLAEKYIDETVRLTSDLVRIPSISGREKELAEFVMKKMKELDYDQVWIDRAGNVIGKINGEADGKTTNFNSHLDTVSPGDEEAWPYPPYSGTIADNAVWGRGASDTKGAFAAQIYAAHILKKEGGLPEGDIYVTGVVREEDSGIGSKVLANELKTDYAVIGEATVNQIAIGNRGRMRIDIKIKGRSCHASRPDRGVNPHFYLAHFVSRLKEIELASDELFGKSSMAPTLIQTSEQNTNVIPGLLTLSIDFRNVYLDTPEIVVDKLEKLAKDCLMPGISYEIERVQNRIKCYTGYEEKIYEGQFAFATEKDHELVINSQESLEQTLGRQVKVDVWNFATDGGHFVKAGIPVIGFSPADEKEAHIIGEKIEIDKLKEGLAGYMALMDGLCRS